MKRSVWSLSQLKPPLLPIRDWLPNYERRWLRPDLVAAAAVWAILVPEGMAYASLAGMPPETGLFAALAPLLAYAVLGTCRQLTVGPSSAIAAFSAAAVAPLAAATPAASSPCPRCSPCSPAGCSFWPGSPAPVSSPTSSRDPC